MCGIIGILGTRPVASSMVDALKRLEYRGYDSAGIATLEDGVIHRCRAAGKLVNLERKLPGYPDQSTTGIGHTRWATHGPPTENNAHPHVSPTVAVVHNGIIENFYDLREELQADGVSFATDTDTEVLPFLLGREIEAGRTPQQAVAAVLPKLRGSFALAIMFSGHPNLLIGARQGSPLAVGHGEGEMFLGSDAIALAPYTDNVTFLEEGDWAVLTRAGVTILDSGNQPVTRAISQTAATSTLVDRGNYRHFMQKEMFEQPEAIQRTLAHYIDFSAQKFRPTADALSFATLSRLTISACGSAYIAGLTAKYWFERYARLPVEIDVASEFRYRELPLPAGGLCLFISQSGETADTLASLRYCEAEGQQTAALVNVLGSTMAREADVVLPTNAGPEIGVASTKAFTCQLAALAALAIRAGAERGVLDDAAQKALLADLSQVPQLMRQALQLQPQIMQLAHRFARASDVLYLGRGQFFPMALEGALKLKELSYIHAEGYPAGELKHGPIALIDETLPTVVIAPYDALFEKTLSNIQEVAARDGEIILITDQAGANALSTDRYTTLVLPSAPEIAAPMIVSLPMQALAYETAVFMGKDADQPRNLAKSVTVE